MIWSIDTGARDYIQNRRDALKDDTTALSEFKRQFPFTVEEAFRNDTQSCIFDVEKNLSADGLQRS